MKNNEIMEKIQELEIPKENNEFNLFQLEDEKIYYGIDKNNNISFLMESITPNVTTIIQETKYLNFSFNVSSKIMINGEKIDKKMHILTCTSTQLNDIKAFVSLTEAFKKNIDEEHPFIMKELFSSLKNLFDDTNVKTDTELQGFYAELYIIYYFMRKNVNILKYWQKKEKMKFDFSISEQKKLEIKSTLKDTRIHHFKHEQLLSDLYDIVVGSLLLRESDTGLSLYDLILKIKNNSDNNYNILLYIENFIKNITEEKMREIKYDEIYTIDNLKFYRADMVPRFNEKTPEGVSKAEYDSDLSNINGVDEAKIIEWIKKE